MEYVLLLLAGVFLAHCWRAWCEFRADEARRLEWLAQYERQSKEREGE